MKRQMKWLVLAVVVSLVVMLVSSCVIVPDPGPVLYRITMNNSARGSAVALVINNILRDWVPAHSTVVFGNINYGDVARVWNGTSYMQFTGGSTFYTVTGSVTFNIPSGGTWVTPER